MKILSKEITELPVLSWLAIYSPSSNALQLLHGSKVEVGQDYFVEGAWNGDFSAKDFQTSDTFFGSGGKIIGDTITFVPSSTTTDYCYYKKIANEFYVSNSLPFILAATSDRLDPACRDYLKINDSILNGIKNFNAEIPTSNGTVFRLVYSNLILSNATFKLQDKKNSCSINCYTDYKEYLESTCHGIFENARDPCRQFPMKITSTQSKGYDSTAVNAIAAQYGLDLIFSIKQGKGHGKFADQDEAFEVDDSGQEIGEKLGFNCTFIDRRALNLQPNIEHLYYSSVHASEDTNMAGINSHISAPSVLLTGTLGEITAPLDYYFARGYIPERMADLERADHGGHGMGEVRLEVGFINIPFFFIGARLREKIIEVTASPEMDPWRLKNNYDRPILRRIAEEAGVPRSFFGQKKNATALVFTPPRLPLGHDLKIEYIEYLQINKIMRKWKWKILPLVHYLNRVSWFISPGQYLPLYYVERIISKLKGQPFKFPVVWRHLDNSFYSFCVNKRSIEYALLLKTNSKSSIKIS